MKAFHLQPAMLSYGGVFYPVGYIFLMFASEQDARDAAALLVGDGYDGEEIALLTPAQIHDELTRADGHLAPHAQPTSQEMHRVQRFLQLAQLGHHALMIYAPTGHETSHIMQVLQGARISYGQKYRPVSIEHLAGKETSISVV
ncbi:RNA-binding protein [Ramlibacter albus]|uniref:RNA-binding protein n=1 Tax=Ramlibacter albus TaxID=2079448 RepID=A0A923S5K6_9BURK|nr:RNA-binding protein [Ramlibacter albus]MBC5768636.1 RNA-binding protein [Ramlibacter albus]